ncbi:Lactonase, 7-bladed beta-propeller-domain-containing protein [Peziza echinospora]|nr:Lactonase, 7-bladed beta-propeller-domain-containing protein [Peziza echinospora]
MAAPSVTTDRHIITGTYDSGVVTVHSFSPSTGKFTLSQTLAKSSPGPSWQYITPDKKILYSVSEGTEANGGAIDAYAVKDEGRGGLEWLTRVPAVLEPVSLDVAAINGGKDGYVLVSASYTGHGINTYTIPPTADVLASSAPAIKGPIYSKTYTLPNGPGPVNPERQDSSHPHQALVDPTQAFVLFPDLGADLVMIYRLDISTPGNLLETGSSIPTPAGFGPRHAVFHVTTEGPLLYLIGELSNELIVYDVEYGYHGTGGQPTIAFHQKQILSVYPEGFSIPEGSTAAELVISDDGKFLYTSNRGDKSFKIGADAQPSDSFSVFSITPGSTTPLAYLYHSPCGGIGPRHFTLNKDLLGPDSGDFITVSNQGSSNVVIFKRDADSGKILDSVAEIKTEQGLGAGPTCVTWI